ncbi:hypothetical protein WJX73_005675 [Symbiochloris irregularis]|uniref:Uncharacterized protein n=1 Tax=Symbiochloris irregularis TaxID=706552 RepID=A0AAW1NYV1_9CHLO
MLGDLGRKLLRRVKKIEHGAQQVLEVIFTGPLQGTSLQMSADKRAQASEQIRRTLYLAKRQRARLDVQAALQATGIPVRQLPASLLRSRATWI